jgi:hypothetical protein
LVAILLIGCIDHIPSPALAQWPISETRLVVVIAGLPEGEQVSIYINGSENGTASLTSPLVRTLSSGATISITADIYIEGAWGYSYELVGVRRGQSPPQTQPSITLDSDLIVVVCEYSSHHILLSPLLIPLYALLILIGVWSIVRWLSGLVQPSQRVEGKDSATR